MHDFWETWKAPTELERKAIAKVAKAREMLMHNIPSEALYSIYIKGSFVRREMRKGSDVDMVPIVTLTRYEAAAFEVNCPAISPVCVVPLSLEELKANKLGTATEIYPDLRAEPDLFLLKLPEHCCIYGKQLNPADYPVRPVSQIVMDEARKIQEGYIPAYMKGAIPFESLLKEVFWLVEWEQTLKGNSVKHSFEGIAASVKDKKHIIHYAAKLRENPDRNREKEFISKLGEYLKSLTK